MLTFAKKDLLYSFNILIRIEFLMHNAEIQRCCRPKKNVLSKKNIRDARFKMRSIINVINPSVMKVYFNSTKYRDERFVYSFF